MSKEQLEKAKQLIIEKRYEEAKGILRWIPDSPTAKKWLAKLEEITPEEKHKPSPSVSATTQKQGSNLVLTLLLGMTFAVMAAIIGFFVGRETGVDRATVSTQAVQTVAADIQLAFSDDGDTEIEPSPIPTISNLPGSSIDRAIPFGETIEYDGGSLTALDFHRPTGFYVFETSFISTEIIPEKPINGAEFMSIKFRFDCPSAATRCNNVPEADIDVVLTDGRIVHGNEYIIYASDHDEKNLSSQEIVGGANTEGWIAYEVPIGADVAGFLIEPNNDDPLIYGLLPDAIDGYQIEYEWIDGNKEYPALFRDARNVNGNAFRAFLSEFQDDAVITIYVVTDELLYFDAGDVVSDLSSDIEDFVGIWSVYRNEASGMVVVGNYDLLGEVEVLGLIYIDGDDIDDYVEGSISWTTFRSRWTAIVNND